VPLERVFAARMIFDQACLSLTHGQYLDLTFESRASVSVDEYMTMISGKTAALIGCDGCHRRDIGRKRCCSTLSDIRV